VCGSGGEAVLEPVSSPVATPIRGRPTGEPCQDGRVSPSELGIAGPRRIDDNICRRLQPSSSGGAAAYYLPGSRAAGVRMQNVESPAGAVIPMLLGGRRGSAAERGFDVVRLRGE